jgi:hypothetical protein
MARKMKLTERQVSKGGIGAAHSAMQMCQAIAPGI